LGQASGGDDVPAGGPAQRRPLVQQRGFGTPVVDPVDFIEADADPDRVRRPRPGRGWLGGRGRTRVPVEVVVEPCFAGA